jgi:hypothetical protein
VTWSKNVGNSFRRMTIRITEDELEISRETIRKILVE